MERNREARRTAAATTANGGVPRRRHRTTSLRDSPEDEGAMEMQETTRLRDRPGKKERDRERERNRERDCDRDRLSRSKRPRGGDESSEESVNDDEDDEEDGSIRYIPPNPASISSSTASVLTSHRKSYPPPAKVCRGGPTPTPATAWKPADEMIGVPVPRKARTTSTKRSHDCWSSAGGLAGETILRQASSSPVRLVAGAGAAMQTPASPPPVSPSSSTVSNKKKIKPNGGLKQRPPKSSTKSSSSIQDEIEIEVAEVLYGLMRQSQGPSSAKQETLSNDSGKFESKEINRTTSDSKSRVSSPVSNSCSVPPQNSSSSTLHMSAVAPKRKRPRPVACEDENLQPLAARSRSISSSAVKEEPDQMNAEKMVGSVTGRGGLGADPMNSQGKLFLESQATSEVLKLESSSNILSDAKPVVEESDKRDRDMVMGKVHEMPPLKMESSNSGRVEPKTTISNPASADEKQREKFEIDLMAPPPQSRSSPEREGETVAEYGGGERDQKSMARDVDAVEQVKPARPNNGEKTVKAAIAELDVAAVAEDAKSQPKSDAEPSQQKQPLLKNTNNERNIDLQLDLDKFDRPNSVGDTKLNPQLPKQNPSKSSKDDPITDKAVQSSSLPVAMSVPAGWHGGLPPMGYVAPLQGVVSMNGSPMASTAIQAPFVFTQPRPKSCATHCFVAQSIGVHQQYVKMPFWPAGPAPLFGAKTPYNLNMVPSAPGLHAGRAATPGQDSKGPAAFAFFPGPPSAGPPASKDKAPQAGGGTGDGAPKKQFMLQPNLPSGAPSNMLHGPAFIFPLSQQAAASVQPPSSAKSQSAAGTAASTSAPNSAALGTSSTAPAAAASPAMSYSYPNMAGSETQYLTILGNGPYSFPIPSPVGPAASYRGAHPQAIPFFNGSFYSSQMLHPSQLQQQQQQPGQSLQIQQTHQNPSISTASSSSQKHLQNQQQRPQGSSANGGGSNPSLPNLGATKNRPSQPQHEVGGEDSPSTADSRTRPTNLNPYGQNFALPIHSPNFPLLTPPASIGGASSAAGAVNSVNQGDKKQQQQPQQHGMKPGLESITPAFAMSYASMNGATTPGLDISSMTQNHAILQGLPDAARHNYQMMAVATHMMQQQKKNYRSSEDGKTGAPDHSTADGERKPMSARVSSSVGQSITFSRPDLADSSVVASMPGSNVVDSSARNLNLVPGSAHLSRSSGPSAATNVSPTLSSQQQQQMQQHVFSYQKQQQFAAAAAAAARSKGTATSNGIIYPDNLSSPVMNAKFPNTLTGFPPLVQSTSGSAQSTHWKNSARPTTAPHGSSPSIVTSTASIKNLSQQQGRPQQSQTQISFAVANAKSTSTTQGQPSPNTNQTPSPPVMVGSPSNSSMSKSAGGSPKTTASTSAGSKATGQASSLSSQQGKNSPSMPSQKPSILGSPHMTSSTGSATKPQLQQSEQQLQLSKQNIQQAQLFFSAPYMQVSTSTPVSQGTGGYYLQRHGPETHQQQQPPSKSQGTAPPSSSSGMYAGTSDPARAMAAAAAAATASNMKGGLPQHSQGIFQATQFAAPPTSGATHQMIPAGFPYVHALPSSVQVKQPAEQKQPAGE